MERVATIPTCIITNRMRRIFFDTWAWYALADTNDADHAIAESANAQLLDDGYTFVTSNYILSESVTLIRYKLHHAAAVKFWKMVHQLIDGGLVKLIRVNHAKEDIAWTIFERYADQDFSFVDCTSFAVMQEQNISHVFTGDHHFRTMGFILVP